MGKEWKQWLTILGGSKITADGDCYHEIKRRLLLGRKIMTILDSLLNNNIQKTKIMASGPTTSWQIDVEKMEAVRLFSWLQNHCTQ